MKILAWAVLSTFFFGFSALSEEPDFPGKEKVGQRLSSDLTKDAAKMGDTVYRVQVTLQAPRAKQTYHYDKVSGRAVIAGDVRQVQERVFARIAKEPVSVLYPYHMIFGFSARTTKQGIRALAALPDVTHIDAMPVYRKRQIRPGDREAFPLVSLDQVHDMGYTGAGVAICVIDDGLDTTHPAFADKILGGYDFGDNDENFHWDQSDCPDQTHGTAVAGVSAGKGGNVWGTAPDAGIVFYKIGSSGGCGLEGDVAAAIDMAIRDKEQYGIAVINMSFGGNVFANDLTTCQNETTAAERMAVTAADASGIVMFASAGNEASCAGIISPSCLPEVISVGSVYDADIGVDENCYATATCVAVFDAECPEEAAYYAAAESGQDKVCLYSNSGALLDILAPADHALTAMAGGGEESTFTGTSSASPFASGVAAVLIAAAGANKPDRAQLLSWLVDNGVARTDEKNGLTHPRVDALASLQVVLASGGGGGGGGTTETRVSERWLAHITPTANFVTTVQATNNSAEAQSFSIQAYNSSGGTSGTANETVPAGTTAFYSLADLFGSANVSHAQVTSGEVTVSVAYQSASGGSPAVASERGTHGNTWRLFPGDWDVVIDAFAVVNLGDDSAEVTILQKEEDGTVIAGPETVATIGVHAKALYILSDFTPTAKSYFDVTSTQPTALIALRFEKPNSNFLWENLTLLMTK